MADVCSDLGLEIPEFSEDTHNKLAQVIPDLGTTHNPVDVSAQILVKLDAFKKAMKIIIADDKVDILVVLISALTGAIADMIANDIVEVFKESEKLIAVGWSGSETLYGSAKNILTNAKVPIYKTPPQVAKALHPLITFSETRRTWLQNKKSFANSFQINTARQSKAKSYISGKRNILTEYESKQLLSMYGITVTNEYLAVNPQEAAEKAKNIGFPVAIKVNSSLTPHKSDIGGLKINIKNSDEAILAYREIIDNISKSLCVNTIKEVLVQEMVTGGHEVILGALNDPDYGPVVMFGMGGIFVEVLKDVSYRVAPLDYWDAMAMIDEVKGSTILKGARGKARGDINALANAIVAFSQMIVELESDFKEIDVNPLVVLPEGNGIKVVDALIITNN
jgi:acetyltransferase